ncbi:glycosyltransferase family 4 protein [Psychroflexus maritimus]|uniref:Glycosyltransferase family 4 protein n=1 Tax=Psychroflexus maritimus TaxID=2714865 RepID=A0A967ADK1_9FLAO|nr:glycosyltransferase family 4 protein [Psychroflexus maritimus]NGZ90287.1 glycosyltransferase family 4 protein [Psychroflexus maritimus]
MILHIANSFNRTEVYKNLFNKLGESGYKQIIYCNTKEGKKNLFDVSKVEADKIVLKYNVKKIHKFLFRNKSNMIFNDILNDEYLNDISIMHCHTLYTDGYVGYKIFKKFNIPYLVTIRSTDIDYFDKYRIDLKLIKNNVLSSASKILFTTPAQKNKFKNNISKKRWKSIKDKCIVVPNGIDEIYFKNKPPLSSKSNDGVCRVLYVGKFLKRKNVDILIQSIKAISKNNKIKLTIVGGGGNCHARVNELIIANKNIVDYMGKIEDKMRLIDIYRANDIFCMISKNETFGLVYFEALSQGLPIIYKSGDSIDGLITCDSVKEVIIDTSSLKELKTSILELYYNFNIDVSKKCIEASKLANWDEVIKKYKRIYDNNM